MNGVVASVAMQIEDNPGVLGLRDLEVLRAVPHPGRHQHSRPRGGD